MFALFKIRGVALLKIRGVPLLKIGGVTLLKIRGIALFKIRGTFAFLGFHRLICWGREAGETSRSGWDFPTYVIVQVTCAEGVNVASGPREVQSALPVWLTGAKNRSSSSHGAVGGCGITGSPGFVYSAFGYQ